MEIAQNFFLLFLFIRNVGGHNLCLWQRHISRHVETNQSTRQPHSSMLDVRSCCLNTHDHLPYTAVMCQRSASGEQVSKIPAGQRHTWTLCQRCDVYHTSVPSVGTLKWRGRYTSAFLPGHMPERAACQQPHHMFSSNLQTWTNLLCWLLISALLCPSRILCNITG